MKKLKVTCLSFHNGPIGVSSNATHKAPCSGGIDIELFFRRDENEASLDAPSPPPKKGKKGKKAQKASDASAKQNSKTAASKRKPRGRGGKIDDADESVKPHADIEEI